MIKSLALVIELNLQLLSPAQGLRCDAKSSNPLITWLIFLVISLILKLTRGLPSHLISKSQVLLKGVCYE